jgi:hypothetical protein
MLPWRIFKANGAVKNFLFKSYHNNMIKLIATEMDGTALNEVNCKEEYAAI